MKEKGKAGTYAYTIQQNGKKTDAQLSAGDIGGENDGGEFAQSLFNRRSDKYHCNGECILSQEDNNMLEAFSRDSGSLTVL